MLEEEGRTESCSHTFSFSFPVLLCSAIVASRLYLCCSSSFLLYFQCMVSATGPQRTKEVWWLVCTGAGEQVWHPASAP